MNHLSFVLALASCVTVGAANPTLRGMQDTESRELQENGKSFTGPCTFENFATAVGSKDTLAGMLGVANNDRALQTALSGKCAAAREAKDEHDLSILLGKGPQFLKNFLDGGSTWNDNYEEEGENVLADSAAVIAEISASSLKSTAFKAPNGGANDKYPGYFSNFWTGNSECRIGAIACCYTSTRIPNTSIEDNAQMCAMDLAKASKSNHIQDKSYTFYNAHDDDDAYCTGFAYEKDSVADSVKYNTLFHVAMETNLLQKGYVKNIPGAPMCGCLEQMPIIDNAACTKVNEGYTIHNDGTVTLNLSWADCGETLADHYATIDRAQPEKAFVTMHAGSGDCEAASDKFMNDRFYVKKTHRNVALGKSATQSSTGFGGSASRGVDGKKDGQWRNGGVTHTGRQTDPWWFVDLETETEIDLVRVYNRMDCCGSRLRDFTIEIFASLAEDEEPVWKEKYDGIPGYVTTFNVGGVVGQKVKISIAGREYLSIAELEVLLPYE